MDAHDLTSSLYWVSDCRLAQDFPTTDRALADPDGLLAIGGDLNPERIVSAYRRGSFLGIPMASRSFGGRRPGARYSARRTAGFRAAWPKTIRNAGFRVTWDEDFDAVLEACAAPRVHQVGTWITSEMKRAYHNLHHRGTAHSLECWHDDVLVGGLYGVALGRVYFGESMFSTMRDASKVAFAELCRMLGEWGYELIDCQIHTPHLERLGACSIRRASFEAQLRALRDAAPAASAWARLRLPA